MLAIALRSVQSWAPLGPLEKPPRALSLCCCETRRAQGCIAHELDTVYRHPPAHKLSVQRLIDALGHSQVPVFGILVVADGKLYGGPEVKDSSVRPPWVPRPARRCQQGACLSPCSPGGVLED